MNTASAQRIFLLGATGTIGRATAVALIARGHDVVCFVRPGADVSALPHQADIRRGVVCSAESLAVDGFAGESFDVLISCLASRTGEPADAWAIDHDAHLLALSAAQAAGVRHMVLLSAMCVQRPQLAFQHAKLAFETALIASGLTYSIVRPTAFFKSLSGQINRVKRGKAFLVFGDGELTACKPISDGDLGAYLADCITDSARHNRILPIGGPGPAITPRAQGEMLFELLGQTPRYRHVRVRMLDGIVWILGAIGRIIPAAAAKAELARIGRYYASESMLVWNPLTHLYDANATPETGSETLRDHYRRLIDGAETVARTDHSVF